MMGADTHTHSITLHYIACFALDFRSQLLYYHDSINFIVEHSLHLAHVVMSLNCLFRLEMFRVEELERKQHSI